ncbi:MULTISPECIES: MFS transporter [Streptomyces]|uniref:MFS transporter n=1 Tax=Streptomyces TaxID=1883 RepID=UPI0029D3A278|nr:MFS transporter [Streptomyces sp. F8]MDX6758012.1 MFS transporter [Streptomyces sp. F8]
MLRKIFALALGAFAVGTSGYVVTGVLPELSEELSVSLSTAGLLTTSFAVAYAIGSPLLAVALGGWRRRPLIITALLVAAAGNALAALASDFAVLTAARIVTAVGAAVFTPAATAVAAELSGPQRRARAAAWVFGGLVTATIVGVPAGTLLVGPLGHRGVFWFVAGLCALSAAAVAVAVPPVAAPPRVTLRRRVAVAADSRVVTVLGITLAASLGVFTVYTYAAPVLAETVGAHGTGLSLLLFGYGIGGAVGNAAGGFAADRFGHRTPLLVAVSGSVVALSALSAVQSTAVAAVLLFLWGVSSWGFNPPVQRRLLELSPDAGGLLLALNASALYLGIGLSGVVGGAVLDHAGIAAVALTGALLCAVAALIHVFSGRRAALQPAP